MPVQSRKFSIEHAARVVAVALVGVALVSPKAALSAQAIGTMSVGVRIVATPGNGKPISTPRAGDTKPASGGSGASIGTGTSTDGFAGQTSAAPKNGR